MNRLFICVCVIALATGAMAQNSHTAAVSLKCNYTVEPLGIDGSNPQLSWQLSSHGRGVIQKAYQILAATSPELLTETAANVWNSGWVETSQSAGLRFEGKELQSRQRYFWKVRVRTSEGIETPWSETTWFETGLTNPGDWQGEWITYAAGMPGRVLYFKTIWNKDKPIAQARIYIAGLGFYELHINGKKVGRNVLDPAQSTYSKRIYYATYDITEMLSETSNVIVASVAPGWYGVPSLLAQMEVVDTDGNRQTVNTDWFRHVISGPTLYSTVFDGESYDARLESPKISGLQISPMMDKDWAWAYNTADPGTHLEAAKADPIQIIDTIIPTLIREPKPGVYVLDAGRNLAGWAEIKVKGEEGIKISLKFAETLYDDGTVNLCTKYLLETLTEYGYPETAYRIATQTDYPSWGFMLSKGATTLWERWEYATGGDMNSHNHPMMGSVGSWFYKYAAGINPDFAHPGFERFVIRPYIFDDLTFVEGELNTVKGVIKSAWSKKNGTLTVRVTIPANTTATVYIPAKSAKAVTEGGKSIAKAKSIKLLSEENGLVEMEVGSGVYNFSTKR